MRRDEREREFTEFFAASAPGLRRTAYVVVRDWHVAEDLTQQALAKLYVAWPRVRAETRLAYARRMVVNECLSHLRRRRPETPVAAVADAARGPRGGVSFGDPEYPICMSLVRPALPCTPLEVHPDGSVVVDRVVLGGGYTGFVASTAPGPSPPVTQVTHEVVVTYGDQVLTVAETVHASDLDQARSLFRVSTGDLREVAQDPGLHLVLPLRDNTPH